MSKTEFKIGKTTVRLVKGNITNMKTDAIVNAANHSLMGGGGVDGAIHREGGPQILEECKKLRAIQWPTGLPTGQAVITSGGNLQAKHVIHTVGPVWHGGRRCEAEFLAKAYQNSLLTAVANGIISVAFPSISTGAFGYPLKDASRIALKTVKAFLEKSDELREIVLVLFSAGDMKVYVDAAQEIF